MSLFLALAGNVNHGLREFAVVIDPSTPEAEAMHRWCLGHDDYAKARLPAE